VGLKRSASDPNKKRPQRTKKFREFALITEKKREVDYCSGFYPAMKDILLAYDIPERLFWVCLVGYRYEFFTQSYMARKFNITTGAYKLRYTYEAYHKGLIYKHTASSEFKKAENVLTVALFQPGFNVKVARWALTQKARLMIQHFYRKLEGRDPIRHFGVTE
jgi:hypothetical protein